VVNLASYAAEELGTSLVGRSKAAALAIEIGAPPRQKMPRLVFGWAAMKEAE
jgi:hypothetical protein